MKNALLLSLLLLPAAAAADDAVPEVGAGRAVWTAPAPKTATPEARRSPLAAAKAAFAKGDRREYVQYLRERRQQAADDAAQRRRGRRDGEIRRLQAKREARIAREEAPAEDAAPVAAEKPLRDAPAPARSAAKPRPRRLPVAGGIAAGTVAAK